MHIEQDAEVYKPIKLVLESRVEAEALLDICSRAIEDIKQGTLKVTEGELIFYDDIVSYVSPIIGS